MTLPYCYYCPGKEGWWEKREREADDVVWCRGQYSDAVLNELESQNDQHVEGILGKVKLLKDVRLVVSPCCS